MIFPGRRLYDIHNSECYQMFCSSRGVSFVPVYDPFALYHRGDTRHQMDTWLLERR